MPEEERRVEPGLAAKLPEKSEYFPTFWPIDFRSDFDQLSTSPLLPCIPPVCSTTMLFAMGCLAA